MRLQSIEISVTENSRFSTAMHSGPFSGVRGEVGLSQLLDLIETCLFRELASHIPSFILDVF